MTKWLKYIKDKLTNSTKWLQWSQHATGTTQYRQLTNFKVNFNECFLSQPSCILNSLVRTSLIENIIIIIITSLLLINEEEADYLKHHNEWNHNVSRRLRCLEV